jgi:hypothetical protein
MSVMEVGFWLIVGVAMIIGIWAILSRIKEYILDKWEDFHYWWEMRITPTPEQLPSQRYREWDSTEGIPDDLPPGTRVVFPNGHYIITRPTIPEHMRGTYGRINKPRNPLPGYEYTI